MYLDMSTPSSGPWTFIQWSSDVPPSQEQKHTPIPTSETRWTSNFMHFPQSTGRIHTLAHTQNESHDHALRYEYLDRSEHVLDMKTQVILYRHDGCTTFLSQGAQVLRTSHLYVCGDGTDPPEDMLCLPSEKWNPFISIWEDYRGKWVRESIIFAFTNHSSLRINT